MIRLGFSLSPVDNDRLAVLNGQFDEHLRQIEGRLNVEISNRGADYEITAEGADSAQAAQKLLVHLYALTETESLDPESVHVHLQEAGMESLGSDSAEAPGQIHIRRIKLQARGPRQADYVESIRSRDLTFGIGPAGTGKTFLAVACAVEMLEREEVRRLVLVRPAVEAGERLGFLPGDMMQKVDPYLRPIYDALYEFLGFERVAKLVERNVIEIAPLAFMRGRTLNHACVIMDEAQNTTVEQMKMFLTRIGFGSCAVVTGDVTQVDLPKHQLSGLKHVQQVLNGVDGIGFCHFEAADVVRHPMVQRIVSAYAAAEQRAERARQTEAAQLVAKVERGAEGHTD